MKTYKQAQMDILHYLSSLEGWRVHARSERAPWRPLKEPYAVTTIDGAERRITFRAQSIHLNAHSLHLDPRMIDPERFADFVRRSVEVRKAMGLI